MMEQNTWIHIGDAANAVIHRCAERSNMLTKTTARLQELALSIGRLEEERKALAGDIADKYAEAKSEGYTVSALRKAIKIFAMDASKREQHDAEQLDIEMYLASLEGREAAE